MVSWLRLETQFDGIFEGVATVAATAAVAFVVAVASADWRSTVPRSGVKL